MSCTSEPQALPTTTGLDAGSTTDAASRPTEDCRTLVETDFGIDGAGGLVSFSDDLIPLFGMRCNFGGCHLGIQPGARMQLGPSCELDIPTQSCVVTDAGRSREVAVAVHDNLLAQSTAAPNLPRVMPGRPDRSLIVLKLSGCQNALPDITGCEFCGDSMPPVANLSAEAPELFETVVRWIAQGAVLDAPDGG